MRGDTRGVFQRGRQRTTISAAGRHGNPPPSCRKDVAFKMPARARIAVDVLYAGSAKTVD